MKNQLDKTILQNILDGIDNHHDMEEELESIQNDFDCKCNMVIDEELDETLLKSLNVIGKKTYLVPTPDWFVQKTYYFYR